MSNSPHVPVSGLPGFRSEPLSTRSKAKLQPVLPAQNPKAAAEPDSATLPSVGPRKLVRPTLPARSFRSRAFNLREESPILAHQNIGISASAHESSHAEAFYFQKQVQTQTPVVVVLEDGEQIEGYLEWYDRNAIKVKSHTRMLIYKAGIKYIYKAAEKRS